ncbi:uncharacterized protein BBOV_IV011930 [Babesia bovis T2Bo]|uniref:Uncharacterized protein n=1 Tax=Babesia bovis TaxID=5865 RepID=A7ASM6_BABBO|nr:uncharacterized protein BBOV_IV011930 [Babesia bovis T2Bo]EDO07545.1 hypothetical protein BBOV_IV011930 [Babesia bovis T2Bo]|eukprot:XP_001611113.1 hypothetical protein [Babesia bovis T2Bo]
MASMSDDSSIPESGTTTVISKRPLFVVKKLHNEIYITYRVPLCVYFQRATHLLRWQLSRFPDLCSSRFLRDYHANKQTGVLGNRAKLLSQFEDLSNEKCDVSSVYNALSKRPERQCGSGVILYGTGRCVTRALYLLQDIYSYVKDIYMEAHERIRGRPVRVLCAECSGTVVSADGERMKHGIGDSCIGCYTATNKALEDIVKRILKVEITTGSVSCYDDVYKCTLDEGASTSGTDFYNPLQYSAANVELSGRERLISSIRISIYVAVK